MLAVSLGGRESDGLSDTMEVVIPLDGTLGPG